VSAVTGRPRNRIRCFFPIPYCWSETISYRRKVSSARATSCKYYVPQGPCTEGTYHGWKNVGQHTAGGMRNFHRAPFFTPGEKIRFRTSACIRRYICILHLFSSPCFFVSLPQNWIRRTVVVYVAFYTTESCTFYERNVRDRLIVIGKLGKMDHSTRYGIKHGV